MAVGGGVGWFTGVGSGSCLNQSEELRLCHRSWARKNLVFGVVSISELSPGPLFPWVLVPVFAEDGSSLVQLLFSC